MAFLRTVNLMQLRGPAGLEYLRMDLQERARMRSEGKIEKGEEIRFGGVEVSSFDQFKVTIQSHRGLSEDAEQLQHAQATA